MDYREVREIFQELKRSSPRDDLTAHIIFTEDSFARTYPLLSRTYSVSSDNKAFWSHMGGRSIFGYCLDVTSDQGVRLDCYMEEEGIAGGWKVEDCYILEHMRDAADVRDLIQIELEDGTFCYCFGSTCIRVHETDENGTIRLKPLVGNQTVDDKYTDLPLDRVYGYCTLLERHLNSEARIMSENPRGRPDPQKDLTIKYMDGPWSNDACMGYAVMALRRAGMSERTIQKVVTTMWYCFDDTSVEDAATCYRTWQS